MQNSFYPWMAVTCAAMTACATFAYAGEDTWTVAYKGELKGRPEYTVTHAATVLSEYMGKVLGTEIRTMPWGQAEGENLFLIMDASRAPKEISRELDGKRRDAFLIRYPYLIDGKKVCLLLSHDSQGYDFPVYYFLRNFMGVDWVGPGEIGEVVPHKPDWSMPEQIDVLENPDFEMRFWADQRFENARPLMAGSFRMDFHHALGKIFAPQKHGKSDPDVYPLIAGKRFVPDPHQPDYVATSGWQPCIGNPKSVDIAVKHVLDRFANYPNMASVSLSVNDGDSNHCTCDLCRAMDPEDAFKDPLNPNRSDRYFRFYNKVIERVLEFEPNAYIAVLGYGPCGVVPVQTEIHDRVCVFTSTGANPSQYASAGGSSALYHYHLDNAYPTIRHYPNIIAKYLRESKSVGGMSYYAQIEHSWAAGGPKTYLLAHLLWDVDSDVDALLDRYMRAAFGEQAATPMRTYFDQWEEVWEREAAQIPNSYDTIHGWNSNHILKFQYLGWDDVNVFDAAISAAKKSEMTESEQKRLEYIATYYQWIRCSIVQYLMAQDLFNPEWLASASSAEVLDTIDRCLTQTAQFDQIWDQRIAKDRTGWLLNQKQGVIDAVERGERFYDALSVAPIRAELQTHIGNSISNAFEFISASFEDNNDQAVAFWKNELLKRPQLESFIVPEINRLRGVVHQNQIANPGFEEGIPGGSAPGHPPKLTGWWFYDHVGMALDAKSIYQWDTKNSRDGSKAIGCGPGLYPGLRGFVKLSPGRYRFSFWYKTVNRELPVGVNLLQLKDDVDFDALTTPEAIRGIANEQYLKFLVRSWPVTDGQWKQVTQTFVQEKEGVLAVTLEPFHMEEGAWVWFDDVEIIKLH